jgi:hypothetical protein
MSYTSASNKAQRPYNHVQHLSSAVFLGAAKERLMAMLVGYFDESYTHAPAPRVYTLGGYISTTKQWVKFEREWNEALNDVGITTFFHMTTFEARRKEYEGWSNEKRIQFLRRLHSIIKKRVFAGFAVSVVLSDYEEIMNDEVRAYFGNHHQFVTIACLQYISNWLRAQNYKENVAYFFESGSGFDADVERLLRDIINDERLSDRYLIRSCSIVNKRNLAPLQAADIVAYEVNKAHAREVGDDKTRPIRRSVINLRLPSVNEWYYFTKKELLEKIEDARERGYLTT